MSKQFPIPTRPSRFVPPQGNLGPATQAPVILKGGVAVLLGDGSSNPAVLASPDGNCCCNDEILGCATCEHFENEFFESVYSLFCDPAIWRFDDTFNCDIPNELTVCCRTFLPTPFAHVQMQTTLGDFFFPNSCFSMRVFMEGAARNHQFIMRCCIGVTGLRFNEGEGTAETMSILIESGCLYSISFDNIQCDRIIDNRRGDDTAREIGYRVQTIITQWENVTKISKFGPLSCGSPGSFGNGCRIRGKNGDIIAEVNEVIQPFPATFGLGTPFQFLWTELFDSRDYLDSSATTQFQIVPEGALDISTEHTNEPCV